MTLDLSWVTPALAVGGCFAPELVPVLAREHQITAVVDVRLEACDDKALLARHGVVLLHVPTADHGAIAPDMLDDGVAFAGRYLETGGRVLVHCEHGIGRSALLVLCVLVDRGMSPLDALELAKSRRERVSPSPVQFAAWASWLRARGIEAPTFAAFAGIAYRHLRAS